MEAVTPIPKIRSGNEFTLVWSITRAGIDEDLTAIEITDMKLTVCVGGLCAERVSIPFTIADGNKVRSQHLHELTGTYNLELTYKKSGIATRVDVNAFRIVSTSADASDSTEFSITSDIAIGFKGDKGDKGDAFTYEDFTQEQLDDLMKPANDKVADIELLESQISSAEAIREGNEADRQSAEGLRISAETSRQTAEGLRQTNTATAITNANNAATNANTKAGLADTAANNANAKATLANDAAILANEKAGLANTAATNADNARLAIQTDLDNASVKVRNLITNGDFVNDVNGWSVTGMSVEHDSGRLRAYNWLATSNKIISPAMEGLSIGNLLYLRIGEYERSAMPTDTNLIRFRINDIDPDIISESYNPNLIIKNLSGIGAYNGQTPQIHIRTYQGSGNSVWIDDVVCINLTETFGAGNEPTKGEMDLLISTLGIDYFEGEITIPAQKVMQWQLKLIRKNKNAIIALGGTII